MELSATEKKPSKKPFYPCGLCNFSTHKKSNYNQHLATKKHLDSVERGHNYSTINNCIFLSCEYCDKQFQSRSGLWRHRKNCNNINNTFNNTFNDTTEIVKMIIKENMELKKMHNDLLQKITEGYTFGIKQ